MADDDRSPLARRLREGAEDLFRSALTPTSRWRPPPEFLVIGGKRCGSTSFYYGLLQHPSVIPMIPAARPPLMREHRKGARYFDQPTRSAAWYRAHFVTARTRAKVAAATGAAVTGEATPWYLFAPGADEVAASVAPDAHLIAVLRDPVARAYSHFQEQRRRGHEPLEDFDAALDAEADRLERGLTLADGRTVDGGFALEHLSYTRQGEYGAGLDRWAGSFSDEQITVILSDDFYRDPPAALATAAAALGLPAHTFQAEHRNATAPSTIPQDAVERLQDHYRADVARFEDRIGRSTGWLD
ncbi:MAG: sulfotransferase [Actinomycetota bacterium]